MKKTLLYIFAAALASVFTLQSCGLEEPFPGPQSGISEGTVEFVARPAGYNNHDVTTKADGDFDDAEIHNAFLLLFNNEGKRILCEEINNKDGQLSAKIDRGLGGVTACILANVPASFAQGIIGATNPNSEPNLTDGSANGYLNTAVLDLTYNSTISGTLGVPVLDLDDDTSTTAVPCIPMIGQTDETIDLTTANPIIQINLTRMFAKVTLNLGMDLADTGTLGGQLNTCFELLSVKLHNLPNKVLLREPTGVGYESPWVTTAASFVGEVGYNAGQTLIYNQGAIGFSNQKQYTFVCYFPEYYLLPLSKNDSGQGDNYGKQEYKPNVYDPEKKPADIEIVGTYKPISGSAVSLSYRILLGEDAATNFTLKRNQHYINTMTITGISDVELDCRVEVNGELDLNDVYGEVANCYVISETGQYSIRAYKGAFKYEQFATAPKCSGTTIQIIAQDKNEVEFEDPNNPFVVTDEDGVKTITFNVKQINYDCNMIIAIMKDGKVEWSWHLWFIKELTGGLTNTGYFQLGTQEMPNSAKSQMVDRNLGATRAADGDWIGGTAIGFYYKYGHRAPYFEDKIKGNGKKYHGFAESDYSTWNETSKSVTDPCPPGYKVPSTDVWSGSSTKENAKLEIGGIGSQAFRYWNYNNINFLDDIYYPYSGYLDSNYVLQGDDASNGKDQNPLKNVKIPGNQDNTIIDRITTKPSYDPIVCTSIEYRTVDLDKGGYLLTSTSGEKNLLKYYYQEDGFELIKCTYYKGTWKQKGTFSKYYVANYTQDQKNNTTTKTGEKLKEEDSELYKAIMEGIKDETSGFLGGLFDDLAGYFNTKADITWDNVQSNYGYQVRCVKE